MLRWLLGSEGKFLTQVSAEQGKGSGTQQEQFIAMFAETTSRSHGLKSGTKIGQKVIHQLDTHRQAYHAVRNS